MNDKRFELISEYMPSGDQPQAIDALVQGIEDEKKHQILLGVTGSGKTYTIANLIQSVQKPTLVLAHNKTLAAQLCAEFRSFFPNNAVDYFISYYDYYQPEAYVAQRDLYIEKEAQINEEIERLRHSATRSLLSRKDVIIVASVSCIYGLGTPEAYSKGVISLEKTNSYNRFKFLRALEAAQYDRNDIELKNGRYRVQGDVIDIFPSWEENWIRLEFFGDELERIFSVHPVSGDHLAELDSIDIYPATHYVVSEGMEKAISDIKLELNDQVSYFEKKGKLVEAQRLSQRTKYDLEMMMEIGYCKGIENYSRHLSQTQAGEPPGVLLDFFPDDFLMVIDESHVTVPQVRGMYHGDQSRKKNLVEYGFRLPSALDNRPLNFEEFEGKLSSVVYTSATPGDYELEKCKLAVSNPKGGMWADYDVVEQIIRPTGLLDPIVEIKSTKGQVDDLLGEIYKCLEKNERVLVTTVTKKMSEDLANFISNKEIKVRYLHSDIATLERIDILHDLRKGVFDVLVGVNLLREGLDLPEVSLVAIMDADKEGFLRNERSLIQTMGRAARNSNGRVVLYADRQTNSIVKAVKETQRRRELQMAYNEKHGVTPVTVSKKISDIRDEDRKLITDSEAIPEDLSPDVLPAVIQSLEKQMKNAAKEMQFEVAAVLRDKIQALKDQQST